MAPHQIVQWMNQHYPRPMVDPEWLDACCTWIQDELHLDPATQTDEFLSNVETQLLESDLRDSMIEGTGLPLNVGTLNAKLRGAPVLVEVTALMEIGHSAFSLYNVRQTRIERADLAGLAVEEGVENDEGPVPDYPRSMLRLELSDGKTTLPAFEYRRIPQLKLGETPLGFKMLLKDVPIRRGLAMLEPGNVVIKAHKTEDRDNQRDLDFVRSLFRRMRKPEPPLPAPGQPGDPGAPEQAPAAAEPVVNVRSPLREISEPPEVPMDHEDDTDLPRKRRVPSHQELASSSTLVSSRYFDSGSPATTAVSDPTSTLSRLLSPARQDPIDVTDSSIEIANVREQLNESTGGSRQTAAPSTGRDSFEYDFEDDVDLDAAFLEEIDMVEQAALQGTASQVSEAAPSSSTPQCTKGTDVIQIDLDDDEGDKENAPVPTRRVRRRIGPGPESMEVIDISD